MTAANNAGKRGRARRKTSKKKRAVNMKRFIPVMALMLALGAAGGFFLARYLEKRTYPLTYVQEIKNAAAEFGLDAYLVMAVVHTESRGDAAAVSAAGAIGLMQIMPATGEWIAAKLGLPEYTEASLADPGANARLGCWYLAYLLDKYGDTRTALAAYNAGPGNVDKWLSDEKLSPSGALEEIPFDETAEYVKRVASAKEMYMELYEGELD